MNRDVIMTRLLAVFLLAALAGCNVVQMVSPYRMEIQQGNFLTQDVVSQLKPGMTKDQVRFLLGTPLLVDPFHTDRWDYVFTRTAVNSKKQEQRRITAFFDQAGVLERIGGDIVPAATASTGAVAKPEAKPEAKAAQQEAR